MELTIGTFNILAAGLGEGEFLTDGGDQKNVVWEIRANKIAHILSEMMMVCDIIVTQENDQFFYLLEEIKKRTSLNIGWVYCLKRDNNGITNAKSLRVINMLKNFGIILEPNPKDPQHEEHYNLLNKLNDKYPNYEREELAQIYNKNKDDVNVSDDGIGIYYNKDKVTTEDVPILFNKEGWVKVTFQKNNFTFSLVGAHLPSGETELDEQRRVKILEKILSDNSISFIVMDSNSGPLYQGEQLSKLISQHGFKDAVDKYYECFKMRHNLGGQPKKWGLFMFDQIDKILYKGVEKIERPYIRDEFGFLKWDPNLYKPLLEIRTNKERREKIKNLVLTANKTDDVKAIFKDNELFWGLYPNANAPSDHPPIVASFHL